VFSQAISGRDLTLIGGGMFLLAKATLEIHHSLEGSEGSGRLARQAWAWSWPRLRCWIWCFHWIL
jgi:hypothetical protein